MYFIFLDDSRQNNPSRPRMGPLVGIGGIVIPGENLHGLEREIERKCLEAGFPPREQFKWSPGRENWMRDNLVDDARRRFFFEVIKCIREANCKAIVVISDTTCQRATRARNCEADVTKMALERVHLYLERSRRYGVVVADRPGGDRTDEEKFLLGCLEMLQEGAGYVVPDRICVNVVSAPAKFIRVLQAADLIVSCTLARVAGESTHAPPVFEHVRRILFSHGGRIGGAGLKLHPDFKFANLYHWLVGDDDFWRMGRELALPIRDRPYSESADIF